MRRWLSNVFILSLIFIPSLVLAQLGEFTNIAGLEVTLSPQLPQPLSSFEARLGLVEPGSSIAWFINGQEIPSTRNKKSVELVAGQSGLETNISVVTESPSGEVSVVTEVFTPRYLDIIIEPQTYAPSSYLGRSLPSAGSIINATALVSNLDIPTSDLVYKWQVGENIIGEGELRGQYRTAFPMPLGSFPTMSLEVRDLERNLIAYRFISIPSVEPTMEFYEYSSLYGISGKILSNPHTLVGNNLTIEGVPYHLDSRVYNDPNVLEWKINRRSTTNAQANPYHITLQPAGGSGNTSIELHVRSTSNLLQGARESVNIRP